MTEIKHIKLSELTTNVQNVINDSFGSRFFWVIAEISGHKLYANEDRHYFEFIEKNEGSKDPVAKVRGVSWRSGSQTIRSFEQNTGQKFTDGLEVLAKVKVEFHQSYGFSLVLHDIDLSFTLGNIEKQRQATLLKLVTDNPDTIRKIGEDYVTKNKEIKLPAIIQRIAVIGSHNSEGYTDFHHTLSNNQFNYKFSVDIYHSSVQGGEAEKELINKLISIYQSEKKYDCTVIIRGGGAKSDFLVFNAYGLSRAVARFPIPVITGVGHQKDVSIVDLMANTNTKTPTKAAEFIIAKNRQFEDNITVLQKQIVIKAQQRISVALKIINQTNIVVINKSRTLINIYKDNLVGFNQILVNKTHSIIYNKKTALVSLLNQLTTRPLMITSHRLLDLNNQLSNLKIFTRKYLINKRGYLGHDESMIKALSPKNILKRGFAIISYKGTVLKDSERLSTGDEIIISMHDNTINTKITSKIKNDGTESQL
jgi:exodeoxyribonuclease VII large subunit